jgi:hypothetical protein
MIIKLNKKLYSIEAIRSAVHAFKQVCTCEVIEKESFLISMSNISDFTDERLRNEFCNYCLGAMKQLK